MIKKRILFLFVPVLFISLQIFTLTKTLSQSETPETNPIVPSYSLAATQTISYGISEDGFLFSEDNGKRWEVRNQGLPEKWIYPFDKRVPRVLTAIGVDPAHPERVAVTTSRQLFITGDYGQTWREIVFPKSFPSSAYLTSIALSPTESATIAIGTAYQGLYETRDYGKTWVNHTPNLGFLYQGGGFYEEIATLAYNPVNPQQFIFACGYGKGIYLYQRNSIVKPITGLEAYLNHQSLIGIYFNNAPDLSGGDWQLNVVTPQKIYCFAWDDLTKLSETEKSEIVLQPDHIERRNLASGKYGIYLRPDYASGTRLTEKINFMKRNNLNAVVIDFKDDSGNITYNTGLSYPRKLGAVRGGISILEFLKRMKANHIYVIGRIVVFKDEKLYHYQNAKYAIWDRKTGQPWGHRVQENASGSSKTRWVQREFWVDPYHPEVWDYNIALAQELESLGVDEIQFDYIRFPTDGDLSTAEYRYRRSGMEKVDALESFLTKARSALKVPISTDLYGFNCWYRMDSWNGQNMAVFSKYVDVVCPMFYPSHFPGSFMKEYPYLERAKQIYQQGGTRAVHIGSGRILVRPYIQAFLLGGERQMTAPTYTEYLAKQIQGTLSGTSDGFLLWNYSNQYYMVTKPWNLNLPEPSR